MGGKKERNYMVIGLCPQVILKLTKLGVIEQLNHGEIFYQPTSEGQENFLKMLDKFEEKK